MAETEKVSVTLPKDLIRRVSRVQKQTGESRSGLVRRALQQLLRQQDEAARQRAYVEGYLKMPESAAEAAEAEATATETLASEPWE
jgi:metal-responsive CopG/Arc/MetJ family transcriptional regulator